MKVLGGALVWFGITSALWGLPVPVAAQPIIGDDQDLTPAFWPRDLQGGESRGEMGRLGRHLRRDQLPRDL